MSHSKIYRVRQNFALAIAVTMAVIASALLFAGPVAAAGTTYTVTSDEGCGPTGSFEWAIEQANTNPGRDTIEFTPGLLVDFNVCHNIHGLPYGVNATESVDIHGNGSFIDGQQMWANANGIVNPSTSCPSGTAGSVWIAISPGFLEVGTLDADNSGIEVTVDSLLFDRMPNLVKVEKNAAFTMTDSTASRTQNFLEGCNRAPILASSGADVTMRNVFMHEGSQPNGTIQEFNSSAVVEGVDGDLILDHVTFDSNFGAYAVEWGSGAGAGTAKIVSSKFYETGGFALSGTSQIVNSAFTTSSRLPSDRSLNFAGTATATASTFIWRWPTCAGPPPHELCSAGTPPLDVGTSMGFGTRGTGTWQFVTSAIGGGADYPAGGPLLFNGASLPPTTAFTSDSLTWVQSTESQSAGQINAILPSAMTAPPGLDPTSDLISPVQGITPLLGPLSDPGVLRDAVPDSACTGPDSANKIVNPITSGSVDGPCITKDVLGNDRWSSTDSSRNIGAVQTMEAPHLEVAGTGNSHVDLAWNRPADPAAPGNVVTAYWIFYVPVASDFPPGTPCDFSGAQLAVVPDPATLTTAITGLTNGTKYCFRSVARHTSGESSYSNEVLATPFAAIDPPDVGPEAGDGQVGLFWTVPAAGGHGGPLSYFVMYRVKGTTQWIAGPSFLSGRTTTIPALTNGTEYEFGVFARSTDGTTSLTGTADATPVGPPPVDQVPLNDCVVASGKMPKKGKKVVTRAGCVTNAGNTVKTTATCQRSTRGDVTYCKVVRRSNGKVVVETFGRKVKVKVVWSAPAATGYNTYRQVKKF